MDKRKKILFDLWLSGGGGGNVIDSDFQNVLDRATTLGYTLPSSGQQTKGNNLVLALKAADIWGELDILYPIWDDTTSNFWRLNWKSPTSFEFTTPAGALTKSNNGVTGNGTSTYGRTGWIPAVNAVKYTLNDASIIFYIHNNITENRYAVSAVGSSSGESRFAPKWSDNNFYGTMNSASANFNMYANASSQGFYQFSRDSSTTVKLYKNGSLVDSETKSSNSLPATNNLLICGATESAGTQSNHTVGFLAAGSNLTSKASDLYTAWSNYIS